MRKWNRGEWVRCRKTGLVFRVDLFSTMYGLDDYPVIDWPDRKPTDPLYMRFDPEELEEFGPLDRIAIAL